jgi:hypothetical protein
MRVRGIMRNRTVSSIASLLLLTPHRQCSASQHPGETEPGFGGKLSEPL